MKINNVAIIFNSVGSIEDYNYVYWIKALTKHKNIKIYSLNKCYNSCQDIIEIPPFSNRVMCLYNFIKNIKLFPFLFKSGYGSFLRKDFIYNYSRFAPLIDYDPDIIHLNRPYDFRKILNIMPTKCYITSFVGYDILVLPYMKSSWLDNLYFIFNRFNYLHCVSEYLKQETIKLGAEPKKVFVIYQGIDPDFYCKPQRDYKNKKVKILTVARLTWQKGLPSGLKAIKCLIENGYDLEYKIVGDGRDRELVDFWIRQLKLEDVVQLLGWKNKQELREIYSQSDIYFQPSLTEGLPRTCIEAAAMELPIVASNVGGIPEIVTHGKNGFLAPPDEPLAYAEYLGKLIEKEKLRDDLGKNGRQIVLEKFTLNKEINEWLQFYNSINL